MRLHTLMLATTLVWVSLSPTEGAFQVSTMQSSRWLDRRSSSSVLAAAADNAGRGTGSKTENLSGLVCGMLKSHQEMTKELKEIEAHKSDSMPTVGIDGVYRIVNEEQYKNFLASHSAELVILKFSSPYCKACKMLKQRFKELHQEPLFRDASVVLADIVVANNNKKVPPDPFTLFITSQLEVTKIPTINFYADGEIVDTIACGPEKCSWSKLKKQMVGFVKKQTTGKKPTAADRHSADSNVHGNPIKNVKQRIHGFFNNNKD